MLDRPREHALPPVAVSPVMAAANVRGGRLPLSADGREDAPAQAPDEHHVQVGQQRAQERPLPVHALQQLQRGRCVRRCAEVAPHRRAEAAPARQRDAALAPAELQGSRAGPRSRACPSRRPDASRCSARRSRGSASMRRKVIGEARRLVDQVAVGHNARFRQRGRSPRENSSARCASGAAASLPASPRPASRGCAGRSRGSRTSGDDLALLGEPDLPVHRARRLGEDGLVAGPAAAPTVPPRPWNRPQRMPCSLPRRQGTAPRAPSRRGKAPVAGEEAAVPCCCRSSRA